MTFTTFDHTGVRAVLVENFGAGSITVDPGDGDLVEGSLNAADDLLAETTVRCDADLLRIVLPRRWIGTGSAHLRLSAPPGLSYTLRAGSAEVSVGATARAARIATGSGDISLAEVADLHAESGSGDLSVHRVTGQAARVTTSSGRIEIDEAHCPLTAKSGSGDIVIRSLRRSELRASSGSGDIAVPSTSGSVDLRTASGSVTIGIADGLAAWLDVSSASGAVRIALDASPEPGPGEPYVAVRARTASGEVSVYRA